MFDDDLLNKYLTDERYLNKKEIMYRLPSSVPINKFWPELLKARKNIQVPLLDKGEQNMWFCRQSHLTERLKQIDRVAKSNIFNYIPDQVQSAVIFDALVDEAFNSSVIEGAFSTKKRSREMIKNKEAPKDKSEQMIFNNYEALEFVLENLEKPITEDILLTIYKIVTKNTLDVEDQAEKYRDGAVFVIDPNLVDPIYEGPDYRNVQVMMDSLYDFINGEDDLHPICKSAIIHFYLVYIHPFFDGNGRTARCIAYMYLLQKGYDAFKFFSISSLVKGERSKYYKVIKNVEDNESDITYFIIFYSNMILQSVTNILDNLKNEAVKGLVLLGIKKNGIVLSNRQKRAINTFIKNGKEITIAEYQKKYNVAYQTARTDLLHLEEIDVLVKTKEGKKFVFKITELEKLVEKYKPS
jgi:Fic family protein